MKKQIILILVLVAVIVILLNVRFSPDNSPEDTKAPGPFNSVTNS